MHYQIYRFTGYLLVHLMVPDFLGAKIYPDHNSIQTRQHFSMPAAQEKKQKPRGGHRPYAPCAPFFSNNLSPMDVDTM
ncbi:hypothetical protein K443DRAFT_637407 [Laccaria amethystina LaAM-08-1]|uniref:Uncharacterized protein n=1 Tax=Laccaria amethystina LaAM-08-1 TaxID=1095629 RepID=A0A0C9WUQ6_9AGAR|nr:hypothetical protein K443DRAFT_637407 [Laccaria amethystina LaAM-08-1]